jgi:hypothetical protein
MDGTIPEVTSGLSVAQLAAQITELAGHLNAANYRWLRLIAEFDRRHGWSDGALRSCAHWLNFKCGLDLGAAREKVRVAHALPTLPKIAAAMARGELSYSKVRALTRVAEEATEDYFLMIALHGTAHHVETLVRHYRRVKEVEELGREAAQQENRRLNYWFQSDGSFVFSGCLPALAGAALVKALEAAMEALPPSDIDAEWSEAPGNRPARRADALALLAESFQRKGPKTVSTADRYQVVVHVDAETLRESTAGRCEIEHGPAVAAETARRLACDSSLVTVIENAQGEPLDVGRKTRSIPPAIRRALISRDNGCRFPGCTHQRYVDAHHIQHWVHGGETKLGNLVTLCRFHHRYVHDESIAIQTKLDGNWRFVKPGGSVFEDVSPSRSPAYEWTDLLDTHVEQGIRVDSQTAATRWRGERMDYGLAIQVLLQQANRGRRAETAQNSEGGQDPECGPHVSAETREADQDPEHDAEWHRHDEEGTFYLTAETREANQRREHDAEWHRHDEEGTFYLTGYQ